MPIEELGILPIAAQVIGGLGTVGGMIWPMLPSRTGMLACQLGAGLFFAAHYGLTGAYTALFMNLLSVLQSGLAIPLGEHPRFRLLYLILLPVIAIGLVLTWHGGASAFAAAATALMSLGRYQMGVWRFRIFMALALPCWFGHNLWVLSFPGMISDITGSIINAVMLYRLYRQPVEMADSSDGRSRSAS